MKPQANGAVGVLGSIVSNPSKSENTGLGLTACFEDQVSTTCQSLLT